MTARPRRFTEFLHLQKLRPIGRHAVIYALLSEFMHHARVIETPIRI